MSTENEHSESRVLLPAVVAYSQLLQLPEALRERRQWCLGAPPGLISKKGKEPIGLDGKPRTAWEAMMDFEAAYHVAQAKGWHVGYVLTADDPFTCIDLDVKDETPQERVEEFITLVDHFDSYTEHSRSGKGFHIWVEGKVPQAYKKDGIEVYSDKRFMICTGNVVRAKTIANRQKILDTFVGNWQKNYQSQSEADLAFFSRMLQMSGLARKKANRPDYIRRTLDIATTEYNPFGGGSVEHGAQIAEALLRNWKQRRHYLVMHDHDLMTMPPARWLIRDTVPESGLVTVYGEPKTGKTFLALDLLAAIANAERGTKWFGKRVRRAHCVYVPFEGRAGIPDRVRAWVSEHRKPTGIHFIMDPRINLRDQDGRDRLVETIVDKGWAGGVLNIDTLARAAGEGFVENSSEGMGSMIKIFDELQARLGGVIMPVHHKGKFGEGMRGHSSLPGAVDIGIETSKDNQELPVFKVALAKDAEMGVPIPFSLEKVFIRNDVDEDGIEDHSQPVFSMVVRERQPVTFSEDDVDAAVIGELEKGALSQTKLELELKPISRDKVRVAVQRLGKKGVITGHDAKGRYSKVHLVKAPKT